MSARLCRALARLSFSSRPICLYGFDTAKPSLPSVQLRHDKALASARYIRTALTRQSFAPVRYVRTALARPSHSYRPHSFDTATLRLSSWYTSTARGHDKALASPTRSLDLVCTKAWQTLTTVSPTFHLVRNTKTRLSLSPQLARLYMTKLPTLTSTSTLLQDTTQSTYDSLLRTALPLQHLAHVRLAVRASNYFDTPSVNPTYRQNREYRSTNHDRHQLPAMIIQLRFYDSTDLSFQLRSSSCILRLILRQLPATNI